MYRYLFDSMRKSLTLLLAALSLGCLVASVVWWSVRHSQDRDILAALDVSPVAFDDRDVGGSSMARIDTLPGRVQYRWSLGRSPINQYTGFLWERHDGFLDFGSGDSLRVDWESDRGRPLRLTLLLDQPGLTRSDIPLSRRYLQLEATPPRTRSQSSFALSDLRTPAWWFRENRQPFDSRRPPLDRVVGLSFESGETAVPGDSDVVRVHAITLVPRPRPRWPGLLLGGIALVLAFLTAWTRRAVPAPKPSVAPSSESPLPVSPAPLSIPTSRTEAVRTWMATHYSGADLSLETMAKELGLGEDVLSREIRKAFQDTFKGTLNRLRLTEAQRLLRESDLGIAEIAYKVGYGNVSHFNRLAKEAWGRTPTEERAWIRSQAL